MGQQKLENYTTGNPLLRCGTKLSNHYEGEEEVTWKKHRVEHMVMLLKR